MKKFLQVFFMVLGIIFFILILFGLYLFIVDPYEIKPILRSLNASPTSTITQEDTNGAVVDKNPLLSPAQEQVLEKAGVDPAVLPSNITPAMESCFYAKLGEKRATEIKNGSEPTAADYFAARSCVE